MNKKKFFMKRAGILVSLVCNLKCKLCAAYSPYYTNQKFLPPEKLNQFIERYFQIVDQVERFTISGGETLLYPYLAQVIENLTKHIDQIDELEIISNGTIVPNPEIIKITKKFGRKFYRFLIDNYGENLSTKINEIDAVLKEAEVPYVIRQNTCENVHCDGWVDYGTAEKILHTPEQAKQLFMKCYRRTKINFCFTIYENGFFIPCTPGYRRVTLGQQLNENEYIDLMDDSLTIEQQRQKIINIFNADYLETCRYCNGMCEDSPRFQPAEQLSAEELKQIRQSNNVALR